MVGLVIFLIIACLCISAWINYKNLPSKGRLIVAIVLTVLLLPSLFGALLKIAAMFAIGILVVAAVVAICGSLAEPANVKNG